MPHLRVLRISSTLRRRACWRCTGMHRPRLGVPWSTTGSQCCRCPAPALRAFHASCSAAHRARWYRGCVALGCLLRHRTGLAFGARIVDRHIEPTEPSYGLVDQVADVVLVPNVSADEFSFQAETTDFLRQGMSRLVATAGHDNSGAFLREGQCRGTADTG